jgi:hypothetical protein
VCEPTEEEDEEDKEKLYDDLEKIQEGIPKYDLKMIIGDFNAKVGTEECMREVAGRYTLRDTSNENGIMLGQFATRQRMKIKSTCFPHNRIHMGTWICPHNNTVNQIEHVLVEERQASSTADVRACRGPSCDTDHYLAKIKIREKIRKMQWKQREERRRWNVEKFKEKGV